MGGVVVATVGGGASPSAAEHVTARSDEVVAREGPGKGAGVGVLRGSDRVRLIGEREGWSEIVLPDGRRAWVPTGELARSDDPPHAKETPPAGTTPAESPNESAPASASLPSLAAEVERLRTIADDLVTLREQARSAAPPIEPFHGGAPWVVGGVAGVVGFVVGRAWERFRSRRDRALHF